MNNCLYNNKWRCTGSEIHFVFLNLEIWAIVNVPGSKCGVVWLVRTWCLNLD